MWPPQSGQRSALGDGVGHLGHFVGEHEARATDLQLGVADASVRHLEPV
jgi:hypothetical protein